MAAPPGVAPDTRADWNQEQRQAKPLIEELVRLARACPEIADLNMGQSRLSRIVRGFVRQTDCTTLDDVLDTRTPTQRVALIDWVIAYADPTGETAVRNVMRSAR